MSTDDSTDDPIKPYRIQLNFTGADDDEEVLADIMVAILEEAEDRGLFFDFAHMTAMDDGDVIRGSPLDDAIRPWSAD